MIAEHFSNSDALGDRFVFMLLQSLLRVLLQDLQRCVVVSNKMVTSAVHVFSHRLPCSPLSPVILPLADQYLCGASFPMPQRTSNF